MSNQLNAIQNINKGLDTTISKLGIIQKSIIDTSQEVRKIDFKGAVLPQDLEANSRAAESALESLNREIENQRKVTIQLAKDIEKLQTKRSRGVKKGLQQRVAEQALRKELRNQVRAVTDLGSAYDNLAAQNNRLVRERQDLAIRQKTNNNLTEQETARLNELTNTIKQNQQVLSSTDQEIGNFRRNVGNYASSWDGLGNSINQLTREFPAFAVSAQTGILAISNNLPILFDEVSRLIAKNKELIAQGGKVQSTFKTIALSILSFQTLLSIGVALLTLYGKEVGIWVSQLFSSEEALTATSKAQESLNKAQEEGAKSVAKQVLETKILFDVSKDVTRSTEEREAAADKLIETSEGLIDATERQNILNGDSIGAEQKLIDALFRRATLQALLSEAEDEFEKIAKKSNEIRKLNSEISEREVEANKVGLVSNQQINKLLKEGNIDAASKLIIDTKLSSLEVRRKKAQEELNKAQEEANEILKLALGISDSFTLSLLNNTNAQKQASEQLNKSLFDLFEFRLKTQANLNESISEDESKSTEERISAAQRFTERQKELAKLRRDFEIASIDAQEEERISAAEDQIKNSEKLATEIEDIEQDSNNKRLLVNEKFEQENIEISEDSENRKNKIFSDSFKKRVRELERFGRRQERQVQKEITDLQDDLRERGASEVEIEEQVRFKIRELRIKQLKELIDLTLKELQVLAISAEEREELEARLTRLRAELSDEELEKFLTREEIRKKILKDSFSDLSKTLQDTFGLNSRITNNFFDTLSRNFEEIASKGETSFRNIADIAKASFALISEAGNVAFQRNIENIDRQIEASNDYYDTILENEELSEEQRESIELQRDQREEQLQQKRNDQLLKQARFNKIFNVAQIASQAAVASISALAPPPVGLGPVFGASLLPFILGTAAAQTALVLAQPLPQFAEGKNINDNYEGMAIWGERKQELKISKDGSMELSPKRIANHLTHVKSDDIIIPDAKQYLSGFSDKTLTGDLQKYIINANISHQNHLANKLMMNKSNDTNSIVNQLKQLNKKQTRFNLNQNIDLGRDLKFLAKKNKYS